MTEATGQLPPLPAPMRTGGRRAVLGIGAIALAALAYWIFRTPPGTGPLPPCVFHELTGLHCPGCGMTRAAHDLLHGQPLVALGHNPLVVPAAPFILAYLAWSGLHWARLVRRRPPSLRSGPGWAIVGVIFVFWFARNLPWWPLTLLAPG